MPLSRKYYEGFAAIIRGNLDAIAAVRALPDTTSSVSLAACHQTVCDIAEEFADYLASDNPNFDKARFLSACGLDP